MNLSFLSVTCHFRFYSGLLLQLLFFFLCGQMIMSATKICCLLALCAMAKGTSVRKPFPSELLSPQQQFDDHLDDEAQYFDESGQLVDRDQLEKRGIWRGELYRLPGRSYQHRNFNRQRFVDLDWKRSGRPQQDEIRLGRAKKTIWRNRLYMLPARYYQNSKRFSRARLVNDYDSVEYDDGRLYSP